MTTGFTKRVTTSGLLGLIGCLGCNPSDDPPPVQPPPLLDLDVHLMDAEVRAGRIRRDSELIGGVTAKARVGDYKIYNSKIAVIISDLDRSTGYHPYGGTILDADRVRPAGEAGQSTFGETIPALDLSIADANKIEILNDGRDGQAARIRVYGDLGAFPLFEALLGSLLSPERADLEFGVEYVLQPGAEWVELIYHLKNNRDENIGVEIGLPLVAFLFGDGANPFMPGFGFVAPEAGASVDYFGAIADRVSYLYGRKELRSSVVVSTNGIDLLEFGPGFTIRAKEERIYSHFLVVGDGDLARTQAIWRRLLGETSEAQLSGRVTDGSCASVPGARVHLTLREPVHEDRTYETRTTADAEGRYVLTTRPGRYLVTAVVSGSRPSAPATLDLETTPATLDLTLERSGSVHYVIKDDGGRFLPSKIAVRPVMSAVDLPPRIFGEESEPRGIQLTEYAEKGQGTFTLPPGEYRFVVTRGLEYELVDEVHRVEAGQVLELAATLARTVDTSGWLSTDTHIHAQLSPDSPDLYPFKVRALVVAGLELPISTEHEAIGDFGPAIRALELTPWIQGVIGSEVTTFTYGHFNAFPLVQDFGKPGNGRVGWINKDPAETFAAIRENPGDAFIQVNHPRAASVGGYFEAMGWDPKNKVASRSEFSSDFDGIEVANGCGLDTIEGRTMPDWFSFLNFREKRYALGSTDTHNARRDTIGFPRTYVRMPTDDPALASIDDFRAAIKMGRMSVSCGAFVELKIGSSEVGDTVRISNDLIALQVKVSAPSWMDVDQIEVVVDGELKKTVLLAAGSDPVRFNGTVTASVTTGRDGWVIVRVRGDRNHGDAFQNEPSFSFTNPIFLDGDGNGVFGK